MKRIQVPAVMVTGLTTEKVENVRIVLLTTVKAGIVPYRPRFNANNEGGERPQRSYGDRSYGDRPQRPSYNREGGDRPYRPRFNNNNEGGERPQRPYNREGGSYDRPQRPSYNREGGFMTVLNVPVSIAAKGGSSSTSFLQP